MIAGISQPAAAERLGISERSLRRYEAGHPITLALLIRMARVYRVPLRDLARPCGVVLNPLLNRSNWAPGNFARVLPVLREATGVSRSTLARNVGTSVRTVAKWESETAYPSIEQEKLVL
jgi:transcriptional regulator with XRE-family HTH domain